VRARSLVQIVLPALLIALGVAAAARPPTLALRGCWKGSCRTELWQERSRSSAARPSGIPALTSAAAFLACFVPRQLQRERERR
jgi:hypothetical protein